MPVTRSTKTKAEPVVVLKAKPKNMKKKITPLPSLPPTPPPLPVEVVQQILQYAETSSLGQCMRVSKDFYQLAGPLLYTNIVINDKHPISSVLVGHSVIDRAAAPRRAATVNLKKRLSSLIQNVTVFSHGCSKSSFPFSLLRIRTLLVVPHASCSRYHHLCASRHSCPFLARIRPQKTVLHHIRLGDCDYEPGGMVMQYPFTVRCPTLTLVLDDMSDLTVDLSYQQVNLDTLQELRIVAHQTPQWIDELAQRSMCPSHMPFDIRTFAARMLIPVIAPIVAKRSISISLYIFRQLESKSLEDLKSTIDTELAKRLTSAGPTVAQQDSPAYTIRTLSDYISEGLEDELLPEELKYWREQNQRRLAGLGEEGEKAVQSSESGSDDENRFSEDM